MTASGGVPFFLVDAFADRPFTGNPAGVCLLDAPADSRWMQSVAFEMQQAETAFLVPESRGATGGARFALRWFTPACEVDLCGHATLASAHVLWEQGRVAREEGIAFSTRSGTLCAKRREAGSIELDFPSERAAATTPPAGLVEALRLPSGVEPRFIGRNRMDWLVEIGDGHADAGHAAEADSIVRALAPDLALLARFPARGVIVTARAGAATRSDPRTATRAIDFLSRFFAPAAGVPEDPVTGSAHCALAPHWAERLHRTELVGFQASARGGIVGTQLVGERVQLRGNAVTVVRGEITAPSAAS